MTANKLIRNPLWATLLAALVAAMVSLFVLVQGGAAAQVADQKTYEPYIINGEHVPNGKYPFMASLINQNTKGTVKDKHRCGGTLIDDIHVLTAGHCVLSAQRTGPPKLTRKRQDLTVFVGRTVLTSDQGQVRSVKDIDVHPKYPGLPGLKNLPGNPQSYDVAVLTLSGAVNGIKPIELATSSQNNLERPGRYATIAGWGDTVPNDKQLTIPYRMQEAQVPIVSDSRADKAWKDYRLHNKLVGDYVPPLMVAAGGKDRATCQGDSGGPLFDRTSGNGDDEDQRDNNGGSSGKYTQIGITSFGPIGCLVKENIPVAYTEVNAKPIASFIKRAAGNGDNGDGDNGDDK
jgi:secreted trypsin-like serine protease